MELKELLKFVQEADKLKKVERQALIHSGGRRENTAEHSWHLSMTALVLQSYGPRNMDMAKVVKMALLHDIVEIYAGDVFVYGDLSNKAQSELAALEKLMSMLPLELAHDFKSAWNEFENGESPEARYISAIDRFLPIFSNYLNEGHSWQKHNVTSSQVRAKCEAPISKGIPELWKLTEKMMAESIDKGHLKR